MSRSVAVRGLHSRTQPYFLCRVSLGDCDSDSAEVYLSGCGAGPPSRESGPMSRPPRHATARGRFFWAGRSVREPLARGSVEAAPTNDPYNRRRIAQFATRVRATLAARRPSASARRDTRNDYARIGVPITRRYLAMYDSDSVAAAKPERHKPQPCRESSIRRISSASVTLATYRQLTATVTTVLRSSPTAPAQTSP